MSVTVLKAEIICPFFRPSGIQVIITVIEQECQPRVAPKAGSL